MTGSLEGLSLADAVDFLKIKGRDHAVREDEIFAIAKKVATRTITAAALGDELPDHRGLSLIRASLPESSRSTNPSVLSRAIQAVAVGVPISRFSHVGESVCAPVHDIESLGEYIGNRLISPDLIPAVAAPNSDSTYPVLFEDDTMIRWDTGRRRFNTTRYPNARLGYTNLLLLVRGHELSYSQMKTEFDPLLSNATDDYVPALDTYRSLIASSPFVESSAYGRLPTIEPSAVFIDMREY